MTSNSSTHLASQQSIKAYVDSQVATKDALSELSGDSDDITEGSTNLFFTNARADARISNAIKDEDNMASDSATHVPSQQSVKAFVAAQIATKDNTDEITEGSSNLYFTNERVDDRVDSLLTAGTGISLTYDDAAGTLTIAGQQGDITSVVAGSGLTGGGTSGDVTLNVIGGDGITANANDIALSSTVAGDGLAHASGVLSVNVDDSSIETDSDTLQVKASGITNAMLAGSIAAGKLAGSIGNSLLSNSAITIDGTSVSLGGSITTNNTQLTEEQVEDFVGGMVTGNTETGITVTYEDSDGTLDFVVDNSDFALTGAVTGSVTQTAKGNVSINTTMNSAISSLSDVGSTSGASAGQILVFDGSGNLQVANNSTGTDSISEETNKYFTDDRVNDTIIAGVGLSKSYADNPDGGTDTALDGRITMSVNTSNGVKIDGDDVELDYSVITDSDLSSGLPSGSGKSVGHLYFLV